MNNEVLEKRFGQWWQDAEKERAAFLQAKDYAFAAFCVGYEWARRTNSAKRYVSDMNVYSVQLELQVAHQWAQTGNLDRAILHIELAQKYFEEVIECVEKTPPKRPHCEHGYNGQCPECDATNTPPERQTIGG